MNPLAGYTITTPFGVRGRHWGCLLDLAGRGIHTGADWAAPEGTPIVAPIAGRIRHRSYGPAFGPYQFVISPDKGQPFAPGEVFFAHTLDRLPEGTVVQPGQRVAAVGALGNVTGPHLHMEYLPGTKGRWSCGLHADPQAIVDWQPAAPAPDPREDDAMRIIEAPGRGAALYGPGYFKVLNPEQRDVLLGQGIPLGKTNARGFDVMRAVCLQGSMTDRVEDAIS